MSIRFPLQTILDVQDNGNYGTSSVSGGIAHNFNIPQDTDNIVVKFQASTAGAGVSTVIQTTDDGGTTWYDVARTSVVSNTGQSVLSGAHTNAEWLSIPVAGFGAVQTVGSVVAVGSVVTTGGGTIGTAAASTLGSKSYSGLPILSTLMRTFTIAAAGGNGVASVRTQVKVNSQANRA